MKKILFVVPNLNNGGAEKSLISVLEKLDSDKYQIDLFAIEPTGFIKTMIPAYVNIMSCPEKLVLFRQPLVESVKSFLKKFNLNFAYNRIMYSYTLRKYENQSQAEQYAFRYFKNCFKNVFDKYDVAISYVEKTTDYIVSEMIDADIKIGYFHSDYEKLQLDATLENKLTANLDYMVTVSENCAKLLAEGLPEIKDKIRIIENIIDKEKITELALQQNPFDDGFKGLRIVTVGRISKEKGPDIAADACEILLKKGRSVKWHWVGAVEDETIVSYIKDKKINDNFVLEGTDSNPYKYIYNADVYVQPSIYEGKCIAIEESKALGVPVVVTAFTNAPTQVEHNVTGRIAADISAQSVAEEIERIIENGDAYDLFKNNLSMYKSNEDEILKLEKLFEG